MKFTNNAHTARVSIPEIIKSTESREIPVISNNMQNEEVKTATNYEKSVKILIVDDSSYNLFVMGELMQ